MEPVTYFEMFIPRCGRTYGSAPCTAALGVTGTKKCYNSPRTCQDLANYDAQPALLRFGEPMDDVASGPYIIAANLVSVSVRPQEARPGEAISTRQSATVVLSDQRHSDSGLDPYLADRPFNPWDQGTLNTRFAARWPNLAGVECNIVRGYRGQPDALMQRETYVIDSVAGPDSNGALTFTLKDALRFVDQTGVNTPAASTGVLVADITDTATSLTLTPAGIGNLEYPASGLASIGGEKMLFTRSGDVVTLTQRGASLGTEQKAHKAGDTFQLAARWVNAKVWTILEQLFLAAGVPASYIDVAQWQADLEGYADFVYSAEIMKPTEVRGLVNELVQQVGLVIATDLRTRRIKVKSIQAAVPTVTLTDDDYLSDGLGVATLTEKRVSIALTFYGTINPLKKVDESSNYRNALATLPNDPAAEIENMPVITRKMFSRWITSTSIDAARGINRALLARYTTPPKSFSCRVPLSYENAVSYGGTVNLRSRQLLDDEGVPITVPAQVVSIARGDESLGLELEQVAYVPYVPSGDRVITIGEDTLGPVLVSQLNNSLYGPASSGDVIRVIINAVIGCGLSSAALVQDYTNASGVDVTIEWGAAGRVQGRGGKGAFVVYNNGTAVSGTGAENGGSAFAALGDVTLVNPVIWGGGGGGGAGTPGSAGVVACFGGNGAGFTAEAPATKTTPSAAQNPGGGTLGGAGGGPGLVGVNGPAGAYGTGGAAGASIIGNSFVTISGTSDIRGPTS